MATLEEIKKPIRTCKECGFPLEARPGAKEIDGVCYPCINHKKKATINFKERQEWLTKYIQENRGEGQYDCMVAVSGGKDSLMIVKRLMENHGVKNPLLVTVLDVFTQTKAGESNLKNIAERFDLDHIMFRAKPQTWRKTVREEFDNLMHPLKKHEEDIYRIPLDFARMYGIKLVFYGENSDFEYGGAETLEIFHPNSTDDLQLVFLGAIYPYTIEDSLEQARMVGFKDLDDMNEWNRQGLPGSHIQIDSIGYYIAAWTKFVKFGFQRVTDIACRGVRTGDLTKEQAEAMIRENDHVIDPMAKRDFCTHIGISEEHFDAMLDKHANERWVAKDVLGHWKRKDFVK